MAQQRIESKGAGTPGPAYQGEEVRISPSGVTVRWPNFMLAVPRPAAKEQSKP